MRGRGGGGGGRSAGGGEHEASTWPGAAGWGAELLELSCLGARGVARGGGTDRDQTRTHIRFVTFLIFAQVVFGSLKLSGVPDGVTMFVKGSGLQNENGKEMSAFSGGRKLKDETCCNQS